MTLCKGKDICSNPDLLSGQSFRVIFRGSLPSITVSLWVRLDWHLVQVNEHEHEGFLCAGQHAQIFIKKIRVSPAFGSPCSTPAAGEKTSTSKVGLREWNHTRSGIAGAESQVWFLDQRMVSGCPWISPCTFFPVPTRGGYKAPFGNKLWSSTPDCREFVLNSSQNIFSVKTWT